MEIIQITKAEYEALKAMEAEYNALKIMEAEYKVLKGLVVSLTQKLDELNARLNKNSKTSNKPPSSDGPKKGTVKNSRTKSEKPTGGQPGHEGKTKALNDFPDTILELKPVDKCDCGGQVVVCNDNFIIRQVVDVIKPKTITVEYRAQEGVCEGCGKLHKASFPKEVEGVVSYGENIQAIVTYLSTYQLLPLKRITELVKDMYGIDISQGTVIAGNQEAHEKLAAVEERTKEEIIESEVAGFDESGIRVEGKNHWLHAASTETCTVYSIHAKRGKEAMDEMGILPNFRGTAIHDHWKSYYKYQCAHGECNQHHLRHLKYLHEDLKCEWAGDMACLLLRIKRHVDLTKLFTDKHQEVNNLEQEDISRYELIYREILDKARPTIEDAPLESRRMVKRLSTYEQETLLFMYDFAIPFTNNLAERDIRMPKAKQKISGGFRTKKGADVFARVRGFVSTVKKRGKNVLDGISAIFKGDPLNFLFPAPP